MSEITAARLRELLHYNPETGAFTRRISRRGAMAGPITNRPNSSGYVKINLDGRTYAAHRLAWLYVHGRFPTAYVDHINGSKTDNRIANLRDVDASMNLQNQRVAQRGSKSGLLGVYPKPGGRFESRIMYDGKLRYLGSFDTADEAHGAYVTAKRVHHAGCTI